MEKEWSYEDEWFEEGNVAKKIKDWLEFEKYEVIKFNIDKKEKGDDIKAKNKNGEEIIIEVKGFPSDKYVSGENKGKKKPTSPNLQAKHWFSEGLFYILKAKSKNPHLKIGMGLPKKDRYLELIKDIKYVADIFKINYFLVDESGRIARL